MNISKRCIDSIKDIIGASLEDLEDQVEQIILEKVYMWSVRIDTDLMGHNRSMIFE